MEESEGIAICRTCLGREQINHMKNIFNDTVSLLNYSLNMNLAAIYEVMTGIKPDPQNGVTQRICSLCVKKLRTAYRFRIMSNQAYDTLCQIPFDDMIPYRPCKAYLFDMDEFEEILEKSVDENDTSMVIQDSDETETDCNLNKDSKKNQATRIKRKKKAEIFSCHQCHMEFKSKHLITLHMKQCHICKSKLFCEQNNFCTNYLFFLASTPFRCWINGCNRLFSNSTLKRIHEEHFHKQLKTKFCEICAQNFKSRAHLASHLRKHTGEKPYKVIKIEID